MSNILVPMEALKQDYNATVEKLAVDAFNVALAYFESLVDEEGKKHNINFEDICNTVTNAAQLARRDYVAKSQQS